MPQADSLTEEQVSEFKEAFSLFVSILFPSHSSKHNSDPSHRTKMAMVSPKHDSKFDPLSGERHPERTFTKANIYRALEF